MIRSVKPCWPFNAIPDVNVVVTDDIADAHFAVKVHKSTGPGIDYQSGVHNEHLADPTKQPTADFWQSDNQENPDFNSTSVATTERKRIEAAITAANAGRVLFKVNKADLTPDGTAALGQLATALNGANPSAPLIPLIVEGFASAEGPADFNQDLSDQRAQRVADELAGAGDPPARAGQRQGTDRRAEGSEQPGRDGRRRHRVRDDVRRQPLLRLGARVRAHVGEPGRVRQRHDGAPRHGADEVHRAGHLGRDGGPGLR